MFEFHKILGISLSDLQNAISDKRPFVEMEIFDNRYEEKSKLLRRIIELIQGNNLEVKVYELPTGIKFNAAELIEKSKINTDILKNILDAADAEIFRQFE